MCDESEGVGDIFVRRSDRVVRSVPKNAVIGNRGGQEKLRLGHVDLEPVGGLSVESRYG